MGLEFGLWNVDGDPVRLNPARMALESRLEQLIEQDTSLLGRELLVLRHCDLAATACPGIGEGRWFEILRSLRDSTGPEAPMMEG